MLEIHCFKNSDENKIISLKSLFNNEELRRQDSEQVVRKVPIFIVW